MKQPSSASPMDPVLVHQHVVVLKDGTEQIARFVCCPHLGQTVSLRDCAGCGRSRGVVVDSRLDREVVDCAMAPADETSVVPAHSWNSKGDPLGAATVAAAMARDVICVRPETPIEHVARTLSEEAIGSLVVVDDQHRLAGIVSSSDLARTSHGATVGDVMTSRPVAISEHVLLTRAAAIMAFEGIHHLVVVDDAGKLAGIISSIDVLRYLGQGGGALIPLATARKRAASVESAE